jgi:hypothetical protein
MQLGGQEIHIHGLMMKSLLIFLDYEELCVSSEDWHLGL